MLGELDFKLEERAGARAGEDDVGDDLAGDVGGADAELGPLQAKTEGLVAIGAEGVREGAAGAIREGAGLVVAGGDVETPEDALGDGFGGVD